MVHPAVRDGFLATLDPTTARRSHEAAREAMFELLPGPLREDAQRIRLVRLLGNAEYPSDPATLDLLEEIIHHAIEAGRLNDGWSIYWGQIGGYRNLGWRLGAYERGRRICRAFQTACLSKDAFGTENLSREGQILLISERALYLSDLERLVLAAQCHKQNIALRLHEEKWGNVSRGNQNLAHVWLSAGRITAALTAANEALQLAKHTPGMEELRDCHAYRAHARALRGDIDGALDDFGAALRCHREESGETEATVVPGPPGVWHSRLLLRMGKYETAAMTIRANKDICDETWSDGNPSGPDCYLLLADLERDRDHVCAAVRFMEQAHVWALAHDAKEPLCWAELVRARIKTGARDEGREGWEEAKRAVEEGLRIARECGFGIFHIDLLLERCRLGLLRGDAQAAEADAREQLDQCRELRQRIQDPKIADTQRLLEDLDGGLLTRYPLEPIPIEPSPPTEETEEKEPERKKPVGKKHVFLSYCHENRKEVSNLRDDLIAAGETVWWDRDILPGQDWQLAIREAMRESCAVVLCLSKETDGRVASGIFPEALDAIGAYRQHRPDSIFLIPVRLSDCHVPSFEIDAARTLDRLQRVDLFPATKRADGLGRLIAALRAASERP